MTPESVEYVKSLLELPRGSVGHDIGTRVWELSTRDDVLVYLTAVMTRNAASSRSFEIAWDIWALMSRAAA